MIAASARRYTAWVLTTLLVALLGGCAQNAVLEIEMLAPAVDRNGVPETVFTTAQVRVALDVDGSSNDVATFDEWSLGGGPSPKTFDLLASTAEDPPRRVFPSNIRLSVRTGQVEADLLLQIQFCRANGVCDGPELRYRIEHPFYRGQRTFFRTGPADESGGYAYNLPLDFPELCHQPAGIDRQVRVIWRCRIEGCFDSTLGAVVSADFGWCSMSDGDQYTMPGEAGCSDAGVASGDGARVDASVSGLPGRVIGGVDSRPQHFCQRQQSCSASTTAPRGGPVAMLSGLALLLLVASRRRRA